MMDFVIIILKKTVIQCNFYIHRTETLNKKKESISIFNKQIDLPLGKTLILLENSLLSLKYLK